MINMTLAKTMKLSLQFFEQQIRFAAKLTYASDKVGRRKRLGREASDWLDKLVQQ